MACPPPHPAQQLSWDLSPGPQVYLWLPLVQVEWVQGSSFWFSMLKAITQLTIISNIHWAGRCRWNRGIDGEKCHLATAEIWVTRGAAVPRVGPPLQNTQPQPQAVGSMTLQGMQPCLGLSEGQEQDAGLWTEGCCLKTEQHSCLVFQAEGNERQKATSEAQGREEILPVAMGCPPAAEPAAAHLPAPRPSSLPSPLISCTVHAMSMSTTAAQEATWASLWHMCHGTLSFAIPCAGGSLPASTLSGSSPCLLRLGLAFLCDCLSKCLV